MIKSEIVEKTRELVYGYIEENSTYLLDQFLSDEDFMHVVDIAVSILLDAKGIVKGGDFVQAFNDNNLELSIARADSVIRKAIPMLVMTKQNIHLNF